MPIMSLRKESGFRVTAQDNKQTLGRFMRKTRNRPREGTNQVNGHHERANYIVNRESASSIVGHSGSVIDLYYYYGVFLITRYVRLPFQPK